VGVLKSPRARVRPSRVSPRPRRRYFRSYPEIVTIGKGRGERTFISSSNKVRWPADKIQRCQFRAQLFARQFRTIRRRPYGEGSRYSFDAPRNNSGTRDAPKHRSANRRVHFVRQHTTFPCREGVDVGTCSGDVSARTALARMPSMMVSQFFSGLITNGEI